MLEYFNQTLYLIGRIIWILGPHRILGPSRVLGPHRFLGPHRVLGPHRFLGPHRALVPGSSQGPGSRSLFVCGNCFFNTGLSKPKFLPFISGNKFFLSVCV